MELSQLVLYLALYLTLCWMFSRHNPASILGGMLDVFPVEINGTIPVANLGLIHGAMLFITFFWRLLWALYGMLIGTLIGMLVGC